jgi:AraC-like DNA-binding protein
VLTTIVAQSPILQKYIECFYIFNGETPSKLSYLAFPHYNTGLSFFKGVNIVRKDFQVDISEASDSTIHIELLGKYINPVRIQYSGMIHEISIIFKPLGLNRFIRDNYHSIAPDFSQEFKNSKWQRFARELFYGGGNLNRLEEFLLSEFREEDEIGKIERSLTFLQNTDVNYSVSEIADKTGYNLKTFQRHFAKHMGCTPVDYRRIFRFRKSMESKLNATEVKSLTDITFESNYFDQSYFIKEFKRLTNHNPKNFFKVVSQLDGDKIVWEIL